MNYIGLIKHILGNAEVYIQEYEKKQTITECEKGILHGFWMDLDSIKNQLFIERTEAESKKEKEKVKQIEKELNLDKVMSKLKELIDTK